MTKYIIWIAFPALLVGAMGYYYAQIRKAREHERDVQMAKKLKEYGDAMVAPILLDQKSFEAGYLAAVAECGTTSNPYTAIGVMRNFENTFKVNILEDRLGTKAIVYKPTVAVISAHIGDLPQAAHGKCVSLELCSAYDRSVKYTYFTTLPPVNGGDAYSPEEYANAKYWYDAIRGIAVGKTYEVSVDRIDYAYDNPKSATPSAQGEKRVSGFTVNIVKIHPMAPATP